MNRVFAAALSIPKTCARRLSTAEVRHKRADISHILRKQELFQSDGGDARHPIYLKGGTTDYVLFITTVGLVVCGLGTAARSTYNLANKK